MPRTDVTPDQLTHGTGVEPTETTIDATLVTNGVRLVGAGAKKGTIVLVVTNSSGAARDVTVQSGGFPGAGTTDIVEEVAGSGGVEAIAITESAQVEQTDESFHIDFESGFTGTLVAYRVPR